MSIKLPKFYRLTYKLYNDKSQLLKGLEFGSNPFTYTTNNTKTYNTTTHDTSNSLEYHNKYPVRKYELKKLRKLYFYRDDMKMTIQLYKKIDPENLYSFVGNGYVYIELMENDAKYEFGGVKNPRHLVLTPYDIAKILLLQPKSYVDKDALEKITIAKRVRWLEISQTIINTYEFRIRVNDPDTNTVVMSSLELNSEDIIMLKMYLKVILFNIAFIDSIVFFRTYINFILLMIIFFAC
jgi:hypothetical protein